MDPVNGIEAIIPIIQAFGPKAALGLVFGLVGIFLIYQFKSFIS